MRCARGIASIRGMILADTENAASVAETPAPRRVGVKAFSDVPSGRELAAARGRAGTFMALSGVLFAAAAGGGAFLWQGNSALQSEKAGLEAQLAEVQGKYEIAETQRQALSGFAEVAGLQSEVTALRAEIAAKANDPAAGYVRGRVRNLWVNYDTPPELWIAEQKAQLQAQIAGLRSLRDVLNSAVPTLPPEPVALPPTVEAPVEPLPAAAPTPPQ